MSNFLGALWSYWNKPSPKADLHKAKGEEVSNSDAILFCIKFSVLALAIFFFISIVGGLIL